LKADYEEKKYLSTAEVYEDVKGFKNVRLVLKYDDKTAAITHIRRISKPGRRLYVNQDNLPKVRNGMGIDIISTSQGLVSVRPY